MDSNGGPPPPPGGGPPPPPGGAGPPVLASGPPRGALLSDISSFSKTKLKKSKTVDKSGPVASRPAPSAGGRGGGMEVHMARAGANPSMGKGLGGFNPFEQGIPKLKSTGKADHLYLAGGGKDFAGGGKAATVDKNWWMNKNANSATAPVSSPTTNRNTPSSNSKPNPKVGGGVSANVVQISKPYEQAKTIPAKTTSSDPSSSNSKSSDISIPGRQSGIPTSSVHSTSSSSPSISSTSSYSPSYSTPSVSSSNKTAQHPSSSSPSISSTASYTPSYSSPSVSSSNYTAQYPSSSSSKAIETTEYKPVNKNQDTTPSYPNSYVDSKVVSSSKSFSSVTPAGKHAAKIKQFQELMNESVSVDSKDLNYQGKCNIADVIRTIITGITSLATDVRPETRDVIIDKSEVFMVSCSNMIPAAQSGDNNKYYVARNDLISKFNDLIRLICDEPDQKLLHAVERDAAKKDLKNVLLQLDVPPAGYLLNNQDSASYVSLATAKLKEGVAIFNTLNASYGDFEYQNFAQAISGCAERLREGAAVARSASVKSAIIRITKVLVETSLTLVDALGQSDMQRIGAIRQGWSSVLGKTVTALTKIMEMDT